MNNFSTTRWSLVFAAGDDQNSDALEVLCRSYRPAVVAWLRRHRETPEDAEDLAQDFFERLLQKRLLARADPQRGRFRSFLLTSLRNFWLNELERRGGQRRGGNQLSVDVDENQLSHPGESPEQAFDRAFVQSLLALALKRLERETRTAGRGAMFEHLRHFLIEPPDPEAYETIGTELGMRRNTIAVAVHRLRARFKELVERELADTVTDSSALARELHALRHALKGAVQ